MTDTDIPREAVPVPSRQMHPTHDIEAHDDGTFYCKACGACTAGDTNKAAAVCAENPIEWTGTAQHPKSRRLVGIDPGDPEAEPIVVHLKEGEPLNLKGLKPNTTYYLTTRGIRNGESGPVTEIHATTTPPVHTGPPAPSDDPSVIGRFGGGWCAPSNDIYPGIFGFAEVAAQRGGLSFSSSKKQLRRRVDELQTALNAGRIRERKLRKQNQRLRKTIDRLIG